MPLVATGTRWRHRLPVVCMAVLGGLVATVAFELEIELGGPRVEQLVVAWGYNSALVLSALMCLARGVAIRAERSAWLFMGSALTSWTLGDLYYTFALADLAEVPFPSPADWLYLGFYPLAYAALALLVRSRVVAYSRALWIDGLIAALTVAALGAAIVFDAVLAVTGGSTLAVAVNLAYPLADALLLALVIAAVGLTGWRPTATWTLIAAAVALFAVADSAYLLQVARGTYAEGGLLDLGWLGGAALLASTAWMPAGRRAVGRIDGQRALVVPTAFGVACVSLVVADHAYDFGLLPLALTAAALALVVARMALTFRENQRLLAASRVEARTDALTGMPNRRALRDDFEAIPKGERGRHAIALYDLDGFKHYNDTFGHAAGDALLARLGERLESFTAERGRAYRMGGDEFCVLLRVSAGDDAASVLEAAAATLAESSESFRVQASYGCALVPDEATTFEEALRLADGRMYARKHSGRASAGAQSSGVLVRALAERQPDLGDHVVGVAELAEIVAARLGLSPDERAEVRLAALLHDVGKVAIPDVILEKRGSLTEKEQAFVRRHTVAGEKILRAAPSLARAANLVRSSHERVDGRGYPDGLAGDEIPVGARIVFVCDAFDAMISERPYSPAMPADEALAELRRCAGTQFDPAVVETFAAALAETRDIAARAPRSRLDATSPAVAGLRLARPAWR